MIRRFWVKIAKFLSLLRPIKKWINLFQSDEPKMSEVVEAFVEIKNHFESEVPSSPLLRKEETKAMAAVEERANMCLKPIHFAANILDPKFKGKNLSSSNRNDGLEYIYKLAAHIYNVDVAEVFKNIAEYRSGSVFFALGFVKISMQNERISSIDFWKGICTELPLSKVAIAVLSMLPTSAATKRSFSAQGFIHSSKRNRLTTSRAGKLIYVHHNLNLMGEKVKKLSNPPEAEPTDKSRDIDRQTQTDEEGEFMNISEQERETATPMSMTDDDEHEETENEDEELYEYEYEEMNTNLNDDDEDRLESKTNSNSGQVIDNTDK